MDERGIVSADDSMKFGLLLESAHAQQKMAEMHLERLRAHTEDLDDVVRAEIRRTLIEELKQLTVEGDRAARALRTVQRTVHLRHLVVNVLMAALCTAIPAAIVHELVPSAAQIGSLRARRDALAENVAELELRGGHVEWRACGAEARLCVRVDVKAPPYGEKSDFYVVKGY